MPRKNRQLAEHERKRELRPSEVKSDGRIVGRRRRIEDAKLCPPRVASRGIARRLDRKRDVTRRRWYAVLPDEPPDERKRERAPIGRPRPAARGIWSWRERAVVSCERHEEEVALYLPGERMDGDERISALEIRTRSVDHRRPTSRRR